MTLETLAAEFCIWTTGDATGIPLAVPFCFAARTDAEISIVCPTEHVPPDALRRDEGWRGFRVRGELDFSLVGILAGIAGVLAEEGISIFAVSTYATDYVFVKAERFGQALEALARKGYAIADAASEGGAYP